MKKVLFAAVFTAITVVYAQAAGVPTQNMNPFALAMEYHAVGNGHPHLYNVDSSTFVSHFARLHYSPCRFVRLSGGIGGTHPQTMAHSLNTDAGFSGTAGAALFLPKLLPVLSLTGGYDGWYLKYNVEDEGRARGYLHTPYLGLILHPNRFVDFEIGGMYRIFEVKRAGSNEQVEEFQIYGSVTLNDFESGAYLSAGLSSTPFVKDEYKTNTWFSRSSIWLSIGLIMKDPFYTGAKATGKHSGAFRELKIRQEEMAQDLLMEVKFENDEDEDEDEDEE